MRELLSPRALRPGSTIGIFTPSSPAYLANPGLFENGVRNLEKAGFRVKLGSLTARRSGQGYRSGSGEDRAREFMELIRDPEVDALIATIGGYNSNSMIPFLDFQEIRRARKVICGFSDVTSLHLSILRHSELRTFYGPTLMCWHGEWPDGMPESTQWFLDAVMNHREGERAAKRPERWSNHMRRWDNGDWKNLPREWQPNPAWKVLRPGTVEAPILAANLNTLMTAAGTAYWPDLKGKILLLEEMDAPLSKEERSLRQLELMGVFDEIAGLIVGKPEVYNALGAPFGLDELVLEIVGKHGTYPIVTGFDCSHTNPMITLPQLVRVRLSAPSTERSAEFAFLEPAVSD